MNRRLTHHVITLLLTLMFALLLAYLGPAIDAEDEENATAIEALAQQRRAQRQEQLAQAVCGPNAAYEWRDTTLQCFTHRGHKTLTTKANP
jgi:hypothetical protein